MSKEGVTMQHNVSVPNGEIQLGAHFMSTRLEDLQLYLNCRVLDGIGYFSDKGQFCLDAASRNWWFQVAARYQVRAGVAPGEITEQRTSPVDNPLPRILKLVRTEVRASQAAAFVFGQVRQGSSRTAKIPRFIPQPVSFGPWDLLAVVPQPRGR